MSQEPRLGRRIGLGGAILLAFNGAIGAAVFALPATLAADFGTLAPWLFPLAGAAFLLIAVPFARSVAAFPDNGGPATYGLAFGRLAGFELGWIYYVARAAAFAANLNVFVAYLGRWWTGAELGAGRILVIVGVTALLAAINIAGVRQAMRVLSGLTLLKTAPVIIVAIAALAVAGLPAPRPMPPLSEAEAGVLLVFYAFIGFENATVTAGETRRPERTLPRALLGTIALVAMLYFLVQLAFVALYPSGLDDGGDAPLLVLGERLFGAPGALLLGSAALASLAGNLHGNMAATPRVTHAIAERGDLPRKLAHIHPRYETPALSIVFFAAVTAALAISGSFVWLAVVSTLARMLVYAATIVSLPRAPHRPARLTAVHWLSGAAGVGICAIAASQADRTAWMTLLGLAAAGLLLFAFARRSARQPRL